MKLKSLIVSNPINPPPGPDVTAPPHVNCEAGWHYLPDPDACFWIDTKERAWDAALDACLGQGASLASVNSPKRQAELLQLGALDPTATGKTYSFSRVRLYHSFLFIQFERKQ